MKRNLLVIAGLLCLLGLPAQAQLQKNVYHSEKVTIHGVMPTENITSLELNPSFTAIDDSKNITLNQMTLKGYFAFDKHWNAGLEVPLSRYGGNDFAKQGLGDITLSGTFTQYVPGDVFSYGVTSDLILPTATDDLLGSGKVQLAPAVFGVWSFNNNVFLSLGYRQWWSVAGDGGREDINQGRIRSVAAYLSDDQWWALADLRYIMDYHTSGQAEFAPEVELGTMITTGTAVYIRSGFHVAGNMNQKDWGVSVGFKVLHL